MTPLPISLAAVFLGTGNCSSKIVHKNVFPKIAASMFVKFICGICKSVIEICRDEVFMVKKRKRSKMDNLDVQLFSLENEASWHAILPHSSFNLFKNVCETYGDSR